MTLAQARERKWRQKTLLGVSLKVVAPTGQYDPTKLINLGSNRWTFKPELGLSQAFGGHWVFDAYGSVFFFTENPEFFSNNPDFNTGTQAQTQDPIGAVELHFSYDVRPRFWVSLDGNFWYGGKTSLNGKENPNTLQKNSRVGITASVPISRRQSVKVSYAQGAYIRFGGDYKIFSAAWQYPGAVLLDRPLEAALRAMNGLASLLLAALSCGEPIVDARDGQRYPTVRDRRPVLDGAQRGGPRRDLLRQRPRELPDLRRALHVGRGAAGLPGRVAPAVPRGVGDARRPPRDRDRRREAEGAEGPRPGVRRDGRGGLHGAARRHGLPGGLRAAGALGRLLDGDGERPRAGGLGDPRPAVAPGAAALPERRLRRGST